MTEHKNSDMHTKWGIEIHLQLELMVPVSQFYILCSIPRDTADESLITRHCADDAGT